MTKLLVRALPTPRAKATNVRLNDGMSSIQIFKMIKTRTRMKSRVELNSERIARTSTWRKTKQAVMNTMRVMTWT